MRIATKLAAIAAAVAIPVIGAGAASAEIVDQYDHVKYVFCADTPAATNEVSYRDGYGDREQINVALQDSVGGDRYCGSTSFTVYDEYGDFVASSISNESSPYVYCALYVNGRLVAQSEDHSSYGYAYTYC